MYRQDGRLVPIEINTNVGWDTENRLESEKDVWDFSGIQNFIQEHNITKVYIEGILLGYLINTLQKALGTKVEIQSVNMDVLSSIPDSEDVLIIRGSYSDEAVVDSYCRNKEDFLKLINDESFGPEYVLKTTEGYVGAINTFIDNGEYPNYIIKYKYPSYRLSEYPKLLKINSLSELSDYIENELEENFIIMPFLYSAEHSLVNIDPGDCRIRLIRGLFIYAVNDGTLNSIYLGGYSKVCNPIIQQNIQYENRVLCDESRKMFLTKIPGNTFLQVMVEDEDLVLVSENSWKKAKDLEPGDEVLSLNLPYSSEIDPTKHIVDYNTPYSSLAESSSYVSTRLLVKTEMNGFIDKCNIVFEDGTDWFDTSNSSYLNIDPEDGTIRFTEIKDLQVGSEVVLLNTSDFKTPIYEVKKIREISIVREKVVGYQLELEGPYVFITKAPEDVSAYASIEHNGAGSCSCYIDPYPTGPCVISSDNCTKGHYSCGRAGLSCECRCEG